MRSFKYLLTGIVLGVLIGLPLGVNIGKGRPLLSNPFADAPVIQKAKDAKEKAKELYDETKRALSK